MSHSGDDLPALFRSLKPDSESLQSIAMATEKEADSRWPLLRDLSLKESVAPPALSTEERECRNHEPEAGVEGARIAALSLPSLSDRMAKSLEKMSVKVGTSAAKRAEYPHPAQDPSHSYQEQPQSPKSNDVGAESIRPLPQFSMKPEESEPIQELTSIMPAPAPAPAPVDAKQSEASLAQIFDRLAGKEKLVSTPTNRPSSFMGRLGMR